MENIKLQIGDVLELRTNHNFGFNLEKSCIIDRVTKTLAFSGTRKFDRVSKNGQSYKYYGTTNMVTMWVRKIEEI